MHGFYDDKSKATMSEYEIVEKDFGNGWFGRFIKSGQIVHWYVHSGKKVGDEMILPTTTNFTPGYVPSNMIPIQMTDAVEFEEDWYRNVVGVGHAYIQPMSSSNFRGSAGLIVIRPYNRDKTYRFTSGTYLVSDKVYEDRGYDYGEDREVHIPIEEYYGDTN